MMVWARTAAKNCSGGTPLPPASRRRGPSRVPPAPRPAARPRASRTVQRSACATPPRRRPAGAVDGPQSGVLVRDRLDRLPLVRTEAPRPPRPVRHRAAYAARRQVEPAGLGRTPLVVAVGLHL